MAEAHVNGHAGNGAVPLSPPPLIREEVIELFAKGDMQAFIDGLTSYLGTTQDAHAIGEKLSDVVEGIKAVERAQQVREPTAEELASIREHTLNRWKGSLLTGDLEKAFQTLVTELRTHGAHGEETVRMAIDMFPLALEFPDSVDLYHAAKEMGNAGLCSTIQAMWTERGVPKERQEHWIDHPHGWVRDMDRRAVLLKSIEPFRLSIENFRTATREGRNEDAEAIAAEWEQKEVPPFLSGRWRDSARNPSTQEDRWYLEHLRPQDFRKLIGDQFKPRAQAISQQR